LRSNVERVAFQNLHSLPLILTRLHRKDKSAASAAQGIFLFASHRPPYRCGKVSKREEITKSRLISRLTTDLQEFIPSSAIYHAGV
jgi:hypothetical protein